jgi:hypothetical protein
MLTVVRFNGHELRVSQRDQRQIVHQCRAYGCVIFCVELEVLRYDRVIAATGFAHDTSLYHASTQPQMETAKTAGRYPEITPAFESVNVPGLYFAGTIAQVRDFRKAGSACTKLLYTQRARYAHCTSGNRTTDCCNQLIANVRSLFCCIALTCSRRRFPLQHQVYDKVVGAGDFRIQLSTSVGTDALCGQG